MLALTKSEDSAKELNDLHPFAVVAADLTSREALDQIDFDPDYIVHCASSGRGGPDIYQQVFVGGAENLTSLFPSARVFLTSSTSVYPQTEGETVTEESPAQPDRQTGKYLRQAEDIITAANGTVLRLAGIYGPDRSVHVKRFQEGMAKIESGEVSRFLNQIHRDDVVGAILHLIKSDQGAGETYNLSDGHPITQRNCYEQLAQICGQPRPEEEPPDFNRKRAWTNKAVSNEKLRATGWEPEFPRFVDTVRPWLSE